MVAPGRHLCPPVAVAAEAAAEGSASPWPASIAAAVAPMCGGTWRLPPPTKWASEEAVEGELAAPFERVVARHSKENRFLDS